MTGLAFPDVSPVMFSIGGFAVRWYSMAYLAGIVLAWAWLLRDVKKYRLDFDKPAIEDVVFYVTIGIIAGGRLGYALFYGGSAFWREPWRFCHLARRHVFSRRRGGGGLRPLVCGV